MPLRHVFSTGLIRAMCGLFRATESRVHKALFVSTRGPKYAGSVYLEAKLEVGHVTANYCAPEACYLYRAD